MCPDAACIPRSRYTLPAGFEPVQRARALRKYAVAFQLVGSGCGKISGFLLPTHTRTRAPRARRSIEGGRIGGFPAGCAGGPLCGRKPLRPGGNLDGIRRCTPIALNRLFSLISDYMRAIIHCSVSQSLRHRLPPRRLPWMPGEVPRIPRKMDQAQIWRSLF